MAVGRAYDRWLVERILPEDERLKGLLYLPFNTPRACLDVIREFGDAPGVIGFTVCATRNKPVHHDSYMKLYSAIEETGKPLAFTPASIGATLPFCSLTDSFPCTPSRLCTTA